MKVINKYLKKKQFGYQFPKRKYGIHKFNRIDVNGDVAYCESHNFLYNPRLEEEKLYNGQPCYYTDTRYSDGLNFYHNTVIRWTRRKDQSVKHYINVVESIRNASDFVFEFNSSYYIKGGKPIEYLYRQKSKRTFDPQYQINKPEYVDTFHSDKKMIELISLLRSNGFIVGVYENSDYLLGMINTASNLLGNEEVDNTIKNEKYAIAYGHGMKVGFGMDNSSIIGYSSTIGNICMDRFDEFDKWSRTNNISKELPNEEILNYILNYKDNV